MVSNGIKSVQSYKLKFKNIQSIMKSSLKVFSVEHYLISL